MPKQIYLDHSATTPVAPEVMDAMMPFFDQTYGNASSLHAAGRAARSAVEREREKIASFLQAEPREIVFTSGATEADNLAVLGTLPRPLSDLHVITSAIEHDAVLRSVRWVETQGAACTVLDVDEFGRVDPEAVRDALRPNTRLVSIMSGNNEIGTVQPVREIGEICRERGILFHTDAVQSFGKADLPMEGVDLLSVSAHKLHGPKGIGFLYVRSGVRLAPILHGGGHERGQRSGTENVPGIVGLGTATELAFAERDNVTQRMRSFRERMIQEVEKIPGTRLNGHPTESLPHIVNFSFEAIEGESLVMKLDEQGIAASTGSACSSPELTASHVLLALGVPITMAHGSLRISTGRATNDEEIDVFLKALPLAVQQLRDLSPFKVGG
jgi:cysteine desulfurase